MSEKVNISIFRFLYPESIFTLWFLVELHNLNIKSLLSYHQSTKMNQILIHYCKNEKKHSEINPWKEVCWKQSA